MLKLAVGIPAYGGDIAAGHAKMWMQLGAAVRTAREAGDLTVVMVADVDVNGIHRARNILVSEARKVDADWLLMIDADTWVEDGSKLVSMVMGAGNAALVGAAVVIRGLSALNVYQWDESTRHHVPYHSIIGHPYVEVDAVGGAIIAVNLHRIGDIDFRWHYDEIKTKLMMSEDLYFCRQLRLRGETILVDTSVKTYHRNKPDVLTFDTSK